MAAVIEIADSRFDVSDQTGRLVAADALQETGRDAEAALLRTPYPVYQDRRGGVVRLSLSWLQENLHHFQDWVDSLGTDVRFRGVSWHPAGPHAIRAHLPNPGRSTAFVIEAAEAEFPATFAAAAAEWVARFLPGVDAAVALAGLVHLDQPGAVLRA